MSSSSLLLWLPLLILTSFIFLFANNFEGVWFLLGKLIHPDLTMRKKIPFIKHPLVYFRCHHTSSPSFTCTGCDLHCGNDLVRSQKKKSRSCVYSIVNDVRGPKPPALPCWWPEVTKKTKQKLSWRFFVKKKIKKRSLEPKDL